MGKFYCVPLRGYHKINRMFLKGQFKWAQPQFEPAFFMQSKTEHHRFTRTGNGASPLYIKKNGPLVLSGSFFFFDLIFFLIYLKSLIKVKINDTKA